MESCLHIYNNKSFIMMPLSLEIVIRNKIAHLYKIERFLSCLNVENNYY